MIQTNSISSIIFDLGGVLLNIDPRITGKVLTTMGVKDMQQAHERMTESRLYARFDTGSCSESRFRDEVREACELSLTEEQLDEAWNALLLDFPAQRVELLHELKKQYKLYLLSNTNSIHYRSYTKTFREVHGEDMEDLFEDLFLSYEMGVHKPDHIIYEKAMQLAGLRAGETLFIDDTRANAIAASEMGIHSVHLKPGMDVCDLFIKGKLRPEAELL